MSPTTRSSIVAILRQEPDHELLEERLAEADKVRIGAPTLVEVGAVPFTEKHAEAAIDAFSQYGKGRHPAELTMGDCDSYATAKLARESLRCIGDDFPQTDLELVKLES